MTIRVGITGGIGSGKTIVSKLLTILGIPIYESDSRAKLLMEENPELRTELTGILGKETYNKEGKLNRSYISGRVFSDPLLLQQINSAVHPRVNEDFEKWVQHYGDTPVVGLESAILFESGFTRLVDRIVVVTSPDRLRINRIIARDKTTTQAVQNRMNAQADDEKKCQKAHFVVINDEKTPLIPQILQMAGFLKGER